MSGLKISGEQTKRLTGAVSDFEMTVNAAFSARLLAQHTDSGTLVDGAIMGVKNFQCTEQEGAKKIMVLDLDVVGRYTGSDLPKAAPAPSALGSVPPVSPSECAVCEHGLIVLTLHLHWNCTAACCSRCSAHLHIGSEWMCLLHCCCFPAVMNSS